MNDETMVCEPWSNTACMGYVIMALENLEYKDAKIWQVIAEMKELFDWMSVEDAHAHYYEGSY